MISLSMIVKNEEKNIRQCLDSVKDVIDEIVVVDTGSQDQTLAIAEEYGAKIFHFDWINDFSAARNYSLSKCSGEMILYLDADERLNENSKQLVRKISNNPGDSAYNCKILNIDKVNKRPSVMTYVRLFPKSDGIEFTGKIHEQIEKSLLQNNVNIKESDIEILHTGYSANEDQLKVKAKRNLEILLDEFNTSNSSYYAFHIGQTYNILEEKSRAREYFELAIQDNRLKHEYKSTALRVLAVYHGEENNLEQALTDINNAIYSDPDQPLNYLVAAQLYNRIGDKEKELLFIVKALVVNRNYSSKSYKSSQNIFVDEYLVICKGLKASLEARDSERFKFFRSELKKLTGTRPELKGEAEFLLKLIDGDFSAADEQTFEKYANQSNIELIIDLILNLDNDEMIGSILKVIAGIFEENLFVLREYALYKLRTGDLESAEELLKKTIQMNISDPAVYFYLISIYLQQNNLEALPDTLNLVVERFGENPAVISQLNSLQQKLAELV